mmetsp:Transcript_64726/g.187619  ORF Transcript_64726/g.187619 Transcript_64726/m.187619 type:complete len:94 (+) Transcript_64726:1-282(+)
MACSLARSVIAVAAAAAALGPGVSAASGRRRRADDHPEPLLSTAGMTREEIFGWAVVLGLIWLVAWGGLVYFAWGYAEWRDRRSNGRRKAKAN